MSKAAAPVSKAQMDPNFEKQFRALKDHAAAKSVALQAGGQPRYFRPHGWAGDPADVEAMAVPFNRDAANQGLVDAISDHLNPGTTGDVVACSVMIDELSVMERAFRVRHTLRRCRGTAHTAGRLAGHGSPSGPFIQLGVEYVRAILKQAKGGG